MKAFSTPLTPDDVGDLIDLTVEGIEETKSMAHQQREGIAALYNILCERNFAYLADEVGMGKTYQGLGLAAMLWSEKPDARILFISPRENLQTKWHHDYQGFFLSNYRRGKSGDGRASSVLFREPIHRRFKHDNLRSWVSTLGLSDPRAAFLRHTSFTRPIYITNDEIQDVDELWEEKLESFKNWGLFSNVEKPGDLTAKNLSEKLNIAFAQAVNAKLQQESNSAHYFDLVILDEAQCLRNPGNQTNSVLFQILKDRVAKWLFMSATPAHGGPQDIPCILNHYPDRGKVLDEGLAKDPAALQRAIQPFMVRRQRRYLAGGRIEVDKTEYRKHDLDGWAVKDDSMKTLETLALGLVQKGLVDVLKGKNNRFKIGFLSSFESLQSSLKNATHDEEKAEWHTDQSDGNPEAEAPDTQFIEELTTDFKRRFGQSLPHPKINHVVDKIAPRAFGDESTVGGKKFLVFTRRVSTVETLRRELLARWLRSVEDRILRCWGKRLDWGHAGDEIEAIDDHNDAESEDGEDLDNNPFRLATSEKHKGWLSKYRKTFNTSGRNSLFFEDAWLMRLCQAGGVSWKVAFNRIPDELWRESWTHASRGKNQTQFRAHRARYLAVHSVTRYPGIFGLGPDQAKHWITAYKAALFQHLEKAEAQEEEDLRKDESLFTQSTLWSEWDRKFASGPLALPATVASEVEDPSLVCKRQVIRTILGQVFRLTDTLIDIYFADNDIQRNKGDLAGRFLEYLGSADPSARALRMECAQWLEHIRLIVDNCLNGTGKSWIELAQQETWPQLYNPTPVVGVVGGTKGSQSVIRQFRTPSFPRVIICTDTLKEGVDLHLFCDQVLHYGVAWTSGDLEQRVGRVDRYFSLIERRLRKNVDAKIEVAYPHVFASLERAQVERVQARQKEAEKLMDSPLGGVFDESKDFSIDDVNIQSSAPKLGPYQLFKFPTKKRPPVNEDPTKASVEHYCNWYGDLRSALTRASWEVPESEHPIRRSTLIRSSQHEMEWSYDAALQRYFITLTNPPNLVMEGFTGGRRRRIVGRHRQIQTFIQVMVPRPEDGIESCAIEGVVQAMDGRTPVGLPDAEAKWGEALAAVSTGNVSWLSAHKATCRVKRKDRERTHLVTLYAYDGSVRIVGVIADVKSLPKEIGDPQLWAAEETSDLPTGYLDIHNGHLVFGIHVIHGELSLEAQRRLVEEVAWRADMWEATLTGLDVF